MHALGIASVFRGGLTVENVPQARPQDRCEGLVDRNVCVEARPRRLAYGRRHVAREIEAAGRKASESWLERAAIIELCGEIVESQRAAFAEFEADLADRHRSAAGLDMTTVDGNFDGARGQGDRMLLAVYLGAKDRLQRVALEIGPCLLRKERHQRRKIR